MNPLRLSASSAAVPGAARGDDLRLRDLLDMALDGATFIGVATAVALLLGAAYAVLAAPVFQADTMIQVEDAKSDPLGSMLGPSASGLFDIRSPASAEMQILRSRLVLDQAVTNLGLDIRVRPRYLPLVGRWMAKRATAPSQPGIFGWGGFVSGNESLGVSQFDVPLDYEGERFRIRLEERGEFRLFSPDGRDLGRGKVGETLDFELDGQQGRLLVRAANGLAGAEFRVTREVRLAVIEKLQKGLRISEEGKQSGVIRASLEGADPNEAARLLNEIGALYVRQNNERKAAAAEKSLDFLGGFLPQLRRQLEESETRFNKFRNRQGIFDLDAEGRAVLDKSVKLQTDLFTLQQKRKELRALYTPEHHTVRTVDAQIASVQAQLDSLESRVKTMPDLEQNLISLQRDVKVNSEIYAGLLNSAQQLRLVKEGKVGNVRVVDVAVARREPVKPQRPLVLVLAAVLGMTGGVAWVFLRNMLHDGLRDPDEIERQTGLHVFATVAYSQEQARHAADMSNKVRGNHVLATTDPQEPAVESLRSLRTALQFIMLDSARNVILVSGPSPGIGKSFTSVNLAAVLGAANKRVLLVDADLRRGHLHEYFDLEREQGLSEVLSGGLRLDEAIRRELLPNLDFLSSGILPPNPAELLMLPAAAELISQASKDYDLVLIDTPPVLAASDAAALAVHAGAVFLVARAGITSGGELRVSNERLLDAGVRSNGVIFNGLDIGRRRYGGGHGYHAYRYT